MFAMHLGDLNISISLAISKCLCMEHHTKTDISYKILMHSKHNIKSNSATR